MMIWSRSIAEDREKWMSSQYFGGSRNSIYRYVSVKWKKNSGMIFGCLTLITSGWCYHLLSWNLLGNTVEVPGFGVKIINSALGIFQCLLVIHAVMTKRKSKCSLTKGMGVGKERTKNWSFMILQYLKFKEMTRSLERLKSLVHCVRKKTRWGFSLRRQVKKVFCRRRGMSKVTDGSNKMKTENGPFVR